MKPAASDSWMVEEERELIQACLRKEQVAWQHLYQKYRREVCSVLFRILGPTSEVDDLVQTVFIKVVRNLPGFEGRSRFSTWLYGISTNVAMDHLRTLGRRPRQAGDENLQSRADPGPDPAQLLEHREATERLRTALSRIKESKRNVLVLHDIMEVGDREIAAMLGKKVPTIRSRLFHARRELARLLRKSRVDP